MALTLRGTTSGHVNVVSAFSVSRHASSNPGDLMLVFMAYSARNTGGANFEYFRTIPTPTGWTLVQRQQHNYSGEEGYDLYCFSRVVASGDSLDYPFTVSGPADVSWAMLSYAAQDGTTPVNVYAGADFSPAGTSLAAPSVTTTVVNTVLACAWVCAYTATLTDPVSMTRRARLDGETYSSAVGFSLVLDTEAVAASGATGTRTLTAGAAVNGCALSVALAPDTTVRSVALTTADSGSRLGIPTFSTPVTATAADTLLANDRTEYVRWLLTLHPFDRSSKVEVPKYFSDRNFTTEPTDSLPNVRFYERLADALDITRTIFQPGVLGGAGSTSVGSFRLVNVDRQLDSLADFAWDARKASWSIGGKLRGQAPMGYGSYKPVATCRTTFVNVNEDEAEFATEDYGSILDVKLLQSFYGGTGGSDGGLDLAGKPKPVCVGTCFNVTPVLVDRQTWTFQVHAGAFQGVDAVYDDAVKLLASQYTVDTASGTFTLLQAPVGVITADVRGATGAADSGLTTAASAIKYLAADLLGVLAYPNDFELDSYLTFASENNGEVSLYVPDQLTLQEAMNYLVAPRGFWTMKLNGKLRLGQVKKPSASASLALPARRVNTIKRLGSQQPLWRAPMGYARNWTKQDGTSLGGAARGTAQEAFAVEEWRIACPDGTAQDATIKTAFPRAVDPELIQTPYAFKADAEAQAIAYFAIYSLPWDVFQVETGIEGYQADLGDVVRVTYPAMGLQLGKNFIAVGINNRADSVSFTLWRPSDDAALATEDGLYILATEADVGIGIE